MVSIYDAQFIYSFLINIIAVKHVRETYKTIRVKYFQNRVLSRIY